MGLEMPFGGDDRESSEMGLKMPSKIDANLHMVPLGFLFMLSEEESVGECEFLLFSCLRKTLWGIESRNFICPWLY